MPSCCPECRVIQEGRVDIDQTLTDSVLNLGEICGTELVDGEADNASDTSQQAEKKAYSSFRKSDIFVTARGASRRC